MREEIAEMSSNLYTSKLQLEALLYRLHSDAMRDSQNASKWKKVKKIYKKLKNVNKDISYHCSKSQSCFVTNPTKKKFRVISEDSI